MNFFDEIVVEISRDGEIFSGTGFYISKNEVATCYHVLADQGEKLLDTYYIRHKDWDSWKTARTLKDRSSPPPKDMALLSAPSLNEGLSIKLSKWNGNSEAFRSKGYDSKRVQIGIGATEIRGMIVSYTDLRGEPRLQLQIDQGTIIPGRSGSPIWAIEQDEAIVGMIDFQSGPIGSSFEMPLAIPIEEISIAHESKKPTQWPYQVVAFDLGGTLIRGGNSAYSWKLIWDYLHLDQELHRNWLAKYLRGGWSYKDWCFNCCDLFIESGLTRENIRAIVKDLYLTKNFYTTINKLKRMNFVTAIISGSIDTFLEIMVPEYEEIFDYIYINKFIFDKNDRLSGVIPTEFDFLGKTQALEQICLNEGCSMSEIVFIGEGLNDRAAIEMSGLSIAYPPTDETLKFLSKVGIPQDDLSLIFPHILIDNGPKR